MQVLNHLDSYILMERFYVVFVNIIFSLVCATFWDRAAHPVDHM